jgi:hypothetical protein
MNAFRKIFIFDPAIYRQVSGRCAERSLYDGCHASPFQPYRRRPLFIERIRRTRTIPEAQELAHAEDSLCEIEKAINQQKGREIAAH